MAYSIARQIVDNVPEEDLWSSSDGQAYISILTGTDTDNHTEHHLLRDKKTKQLLAADYYHLTGDIASNFVLGEAINTLEGIAHQGTTYEVFLRIGGLDNTIYLDLCNDDWEAIQIKKSGWKLRRNPPIKFRRTSGMLPLPVPEKGGDLDRDLRPLLNASNNDDWLLMKAWLLSHLIPSPPHPILCFRGQQDTAKSYNQKILRSIVDPSLLPVRRPARKTEDLVIGGLNSWVISFDNMSRIGDLLSDDLCTMSTFGGSAKRSLYTNTDETILEMSRPVIMNGISDIISKQDLLDRSIYIELFEIPPESRTPEVKLMEDFHEKLPKILGSLLDHAVLGLKNQDKIVLQNPYRMAGFVKFAAAALGKEGDAFQIAYQLNTDKGVARAIADNVLINRLLEFVPNYAFQAKSMNHDEIWRGGAQQLLRELKYGMGESLAEQLPKQANKLTEVLTTLIPALKSQGIKAEQKGRKGKSRIYQWELSMIPEATKEAKEATK